MLTKSIFVRCWRFAVVAGILTVPRCSGQVPSQRQSPTGVNHPNQQEIQSASNSSDEGLGDEVRQGTALTRQGRFKEAIPHLLAAQGQAKNDYALNFNLSLCYVGTSEYKKAIAILNDLRRQGHENADVENLLAQSYVGDGQGSDALAALERAATISPQNEKMYAFVADACGDHQEFELGLKVLEIGLRNLPQSARLHYEKGMLLAELDQLDRAKEDFDLAKRLGQGSEIGYLAAAHHSLLEGNIPDTVRIARESISRGFQSPTILTILGQGLLRSGIQPGQPEFSEAQSALERSIAGRPNDASGQIALGQIYLMAGRVDDAIAHLQTAREMRPNQPAIYASLAKAYQRRGDSGKAQEALAILERLNAAQAERIRSAPGERKMSYGGTSSVDPH